MRNVTADVRNSQIYIVFGMLLGTGVFILCSFWLAPLMIKPINHLKNVVNSFSLGDYDAHVIIKSKDEIGELADMMRRLKQAQVTKLLLAEAFGTW